MSNVSIEECQTWLEPVKGDLESNLDSQLEESVATIVLARISQAYDTSGWIDTSTTPRLVRKVIAMYYAATYYERQYSEDDAGNPYATNLRAWADTLITGIVDGTIDLIDEPGQISPANASVAFYPTDRSSSMEPTPEDRSLGPEVFSMGVVF